MSELQNDHFAPRWRSRHAVCGLCRNFPETAVILERATWVSSVRGSLFALVAFLARASLPSAVLTHGLGPLLPARLAAFHAHPTRHHVAPAPRRVLHSPKRNDRQHQMARVLFVVINPVHHGAALIEDGVRDVTTAVDIGSKSWPFDIRLQPWVFRPPTGLLPMGFYCATSPGVASAIRAAWLYRMGRCLRK